MDESDLRIRNHLYSSFVRAGNACTPAETAAELGLGVEEARRAYRRLHDAHALVLEPDGETIRMLNPFSSVETPHRVVEANGRSWWANCAWDALGIPAALHVDARIESACPDCAERLELEVRDGEVVRGADVLVHFAVPARHWWDDIVFT